MGETAAVLGIDVSTTATKAIVVDPAGRVMGIASSGYGLGASIATPATTEGAAYGAALLAAVGAGWFPTVEAAVDAVVRATPAADPGPDSVHSTEAHAVYRELYPALDPSFHRM